MSSLDASLALESGRTGPADERPLTPQEYQLLQRLLSDPFSIPIQFKTWLVSFLESSDLTLPISAIAGLQALLGITAVGGGTLGILPAGIIFPYGGTTAPAGAKMCNGSAYSRSIEKRLFDAIGTSFGAPDGATFNVPDIRERIPVGLGTKAGFNVLGQNEGKPLGQRGTVHGSTVSETPHAHTYGRSNQSLTPGGTAYVTAQRDVHDFETDAAVTGIKVGPQSGVPMDDVAHLVLNFIIVS